MERTTNTLYRVSKDATDNTHWYKQMSEAVGKVGLPIKTKGDYVQLYFGETNEKINNFYFPLSACILTRSMEIG